MRRISRVLVAAEVFFLAVPSALACTGFLYVLRPAFAGWDDLVVADALPLDELPRRAGVSFILFALVWAGLGVSVGFFAPSLRHLAGFTASVWLWQSAGTTASLVVVRQEGVLRAAGAALSIAAVYLAPLLALFAAVGVRILFHPERRPRLLRAQTASST